MGIKIQEISNKDWNDLVTTEKKPVFIMFFSPTCPHCHTIEPYFNQYAEELKKDVLFLKMNIQENQIIAQQFGILGTPTFIFFCHGKPIQSIVGSIYPSLLKKTVQEGLQNGSDCVKKTTWFEGISGYA
jgi:thioredoxin-like negative regulator of GroEL